MTELVEKVRQLAELEVRLVELQQEEKRLKKEVFDLNIAAHNKKADVEAMEGFSPKNLLMKLTGTYEDKLEEARREARTAKSQHSFSAAQLENVCLQLAQIDQSLEKLQGSAQLLSDALREKLGENPCAEEETQLAALEMALHVGEALENVGKALQEALNTAMDWIGTKPGMYAAIGEMRRAETQAQEQLNQYMDQLNVLQQYLTALGCPLNVGEMEKFDRDYLTGLLTGFMTGNRYLTVQQQLVQINRQWNQLLPQLSDRLHSARAEWMEELCRAADT